MTNLSHVTFTGAIREAATELGRAPSEEQVANLNLVLQTLADRDDETGALTVATEAGSVPFADYLTEQAGRFPKPTASSNVPAGLRSALDRIKADAAKGILRTGSGVQQGRPRGDAFADIVRGLEARHQIALAAEAATYPNPWLPGQINRTRQVVITKADPARAAQYRAEAGI
jgi:hypothetical protein